MTEQSETTRPSGRLLYVLAFAFVVIGLLNAMPAVPELEPIVRKLTGLPWLEIRRFSPEYFYPLVFVVMMVIVTLKHSIWHSWADKGTLRKRLGLFLDIALVVSAVAIAITYTVELQAICLIDQITGERARLIAETLQVEIENAKIFGLPEPTTVDDPNCVANTGGWIVAIVGASVIIFLAYNVKVWGLPLVLVAIAIVAYTFFTIAMWYFFGADELNKYLTTKLGGEPRLLSDGRPRIHDILTNNASGFLGQFMDIIMNTIFPYIILGSLFGVSAGGQSLIKLAFRWTRHLRGGPAHAAIVSSAMFGTISGGPVVNVLSTGVLTIPMMIKRGFSKVFAGGVEAAASSGGSIMPPVMGVAAFVLAALTSVPYSFVIVAAVIPAFAYFLCLFLSVVFQSRKQGIEAIGELTEEMMLNRQDKLNVIMIFAPILLILILLITSKQDVGCGFLAVYLGIDRVIDGARCIVNDMPWFMKLIQNSAGDAGSAGWWAVLLLMGLLFVDPEMRARPRLLIDALSNAGILISTLYLMFLAVTIIDFCLRLTGLPNFISLDVLAWLQSFKLGEGGSVLFKFLALFATMILAVLLGMGMPAVPAYINVTLVMGPVLAGLGISFFTANMFIFYFAVASAITPPVALAAFAAASITKQDPMATGFSAVRSGIAMFVIPFVFAMYPELLLIEQAQIDPSSTGAQKVFLPGYDGTIALGHMTVLLLRLSLALYLLTSALARFDKRSLPLWNCALRIGLCVLILVANPLVYIPAATLAIALISLRHGQTKEVAG